MVNQGEILAWREVYVKENLCILSFLFYARKCSFLNHAESQRKIIGICVTRSCPSVSHLHFADNSIFFCEMEPRECEEVMKVVRKYGQASGQCINFEKSSQLFGKRIGTNVRQQIKHTLGIQNEGGNETRISTDISGSKCKFFSFLKDKLIHRMNGWTWRWLSKGGKEILIKSIMLVLPTYVMSTFLSRWRYVKILQVPVHNYVELKFTKERNSLGRMKKDLFTKRRGQNWFLYDPWIQPSFTCKTTLATSPIPRFVSNSSFERKILHNEFVFANKLCKQSSYVWTSISAI